MHGDQRTAFINIIAVIFRRLIKYGLALLILTRPDFTFSMLVDDWNGENMRAPRFQNSANFPERQIRFENMLHHILRYEKVERIISEGKAFQ